MRKWVVLLASVLVVLGLAFVNRWWVLMNVMSALGPPALAEAEHEPGAVWFDDYYAVLEIDERTFAIAETRYWQANFNYLIVGDARALLFDAGPGIRDIRGVVQSLTDLPVVFTPSHFHYDHVANGVEFEDVALVDLPYLRRRAGEGRLRLTLDEHLGKSEGFDLPTLQVDEWWRSGATIDLGNRELIVVHTPGHTLDSVSLVDQRAGYAFTGDFFGPGSLLELVPTGGMGDYLHGVNNLLSHVDADTRLFAAHRDLLADPVPKGIPQTTFADLEDLQRLLPRIRDGAVDGRGLFPVVYTANDNVDLWANPRWMQNWERSSIE